MACNAAAFPRCTPTSFWLWERNLWDLTVSRSGWWLQMPTVANATISFPCCQTITTRLSIKRTLCCNEILTGSLRRVVSVFRHCTPVRPHLQTACQSLEHCQSIGACKSEVPKASAVFTVRTVCFVRHRCIFVASGMRTWCGRSCASARFRHLWRWSQFDRLTISGSS